MGALYIRARLVNAYRRVFPHPSVVAMRERRRVASSAASSRATEQRAFVKATTERLRSEVSGR